MRHTIIAVGKLKSGDEQRLLNHYLKQIKPAVALIELADAPSSLPSAARKTKEADTIISKIPKGAYVIALDSRGDNASSEALSKQLQAHAIQGKSICWIIGGQDGLDETVLARGDTSISFGQLTWPHKLARIMLAEQLFRIQSIVNNHPYHLGH